jgi:hypothetical protein
LHEYVSNGKNKRWNSNLRIKTANTNIKIQKQRPPLNLLIRNKFQTKLQSPLNNNLNSDILVSRSSVDFDEDHNSILNEANRRTCFIESIKFNGTKKNFHVGIFGSNGVNFLCDQ